MATITARTCYASTTRSMITHMVWWRIATGRPEAGSTSGGTCSRLSSHDADGRRPYKRAHRDSGGRTTACLFVRPAFGGGMAGADLGPLSLGLLPHCPTPLKAFG